LTWVEIGHMHIGSAGRAGEMLRVSSVPPSVLASLVNGARTARLFVDEYVPRFREN
jgi:hypothetical protein